MCGRFVQLKRRRDYERYMQMLAARDRLPDHDLSDIAEPNWNIPPSSLVWVVRHLDDDLRMDRLAWGWPAGPDARLVSNARLESADEKPLFRDAWHARRCLVPVEGWYEWQPLGGSRRQPYYFTLRSREPVLLAGLWTGDAFVLLTTATHAKLAVVHSRRPVALPLPEARRWCDPSVPWSRIDLEQACLLEEAFDLVPVSPAVNSTRQNGPELVQPLEAARVARADLLLPGF